MQQFCGHRKALRIKKQKKTKETKTKRKKKTAKEKKKKKAKIKNRLFVKRVYNLRYVLVVRRVNLKRLETIP